MRPNSPRRPTVSTISLDHLAFNYHSVKQFIGPDVACMAVVKADAYGHGAIECSRRLESEGVEWFGVALPEEGVELRRAGITRPILVLGSFWDSQASLVVENGLRPVVFTSQHLAALDAAASALGTVADYHIKIDTGMGRIGVRWDEVDDLASTLGQYSHARLDGLMTHFAAADDLGQNAFTATQIERFDASVAIFAGYGFSPTYIDLANSPGAVAHPEARRRLVRLGGVLYGLGGDVLPKGIATPDLKPVLSLSSRIACLKTVPPGESLGYGRTFFTKRESRIATVPIGYADGFPRMLSNNASMIVNGKLAPVVGRVSMDWTIIDVTDIRNVAIGTEVIIIGSEGAAEVRAEDLAACAATISYEITCGIQSRVHRVFE